MDIRTEDIPSLEAGIFRNADKLKALSKLEEADSEEYLDALEFLVAYATHLTRAIEEEIRNEGG